MIPEKYLIDFDKLEVGQELYYIGDGVCILESKTKTKPYPVEVRFKNRQTCDFTIDGKVFESDSLPTLFLSNPYEKEEFKERLMWVSDGNNSWVKKFVLGIIDGFYITKNIYGNHRPVSWQYAKEIETQTFTIDQAKEKLAELMNINKDEIEIKS